MVVILVFHYLFIGSGFPLDEKLLWLVSGMASLLLGSRLISPYFTPPADAATNAFFASTAMSTALSTHPTQWGDKVVIWITFALHKSVSRKFTTCNRILLMLNCR